MAGPRCNPAIKGHGGLQDHPGAAFRDILEKGAVELEGVFGENPFHHLDPFALEPLATAGGLRVGIVAATTTLWMPAERIFSVQGGVFP